jgi:hypothetical protein
MRDLLTSAVIVSLLVGAAGQPAADEPREPPSVRGNEPAPRSSRSNLAARFPGFHDFVTTGGGASLRQSFMEEMRHVPTLEPKLQRLMRVQQEKQAVRQKLEQTARLTNRPSSELWREFHDLLAKQDELTSQQTEIVSDLQRDADVIQDELVARRNEVSARLEELRRSGKEGADQRPESRSQSRILRMYDMLIERMPALKESPSEGEWVLGFMRGMHVPMDGVDPRVLEQARSHLQQLEQDCDELRSRMRTIEEQIGELRELLDVAASPSSRRSGRTVPDRTTRPGTQPSRRRPGTAREALPPDAGNTEESTATETR